MKKTNLIFKLVAAALVVCLTLSMCVSCNGSNEAVLTLTVDGKDYTMTESEFSLLMKIKKLDYACSMLITTSQDASVWSQVYDEEEGTTYEDVYKELIVKQAKAILVEKYLFDSLDLTISEDKLAEHREEMTSEIKSQGGKGAYKQYYGYTANDYYTTYVQMVDRSELVLDELYGEDGAYKVTDEDLAKYYTENYVGYQFIMLDMENKVVRDDDGNRIVETEEDEDGNEVESDAYKTEALSDDEKSEKQILADKILAELEAGTATFEELIEKYSDEYYSVEFPEGQFVLADGTFIDSTVTEAVKDLEIGEYTTEAISVNSDAYQYIVKRVELKENAYNDDKYLELFDGYEDTVMYDKYETYVMTFFDKITVNETVLAKYTMANTFLSEYADAYYQYYLYYYYGISY